QVGASPSRPPHARPPALAALDVGLDIDEPQILGSELFPLRHERMPVDARPQEVRVSPRPPQPAPLASGAVSPRLDVDQPQALAGQLLPLALELSPRHSQPQVVRVRPPTPNPSERRC